jgi:hypothetical protein
MSQTADHEDTETPADHEIPMPGIATTDLTNHHQNREGGGRAVCTMERNLVALAAQSLFASNAEIYSNGGDRRNKVLHKVKPEVPPFVPLILTWSLPIHPHSSFRQPHSQSIDVCLDLSTVGSN